MLAIYQPCTYKSYKESGYDDYPLYKVALGLLLTIESYSEIVASGIDLIADAVDRWNRVRKCIVRCSKLWNQFP